MLSIVRKSFPLLCLALCLLALTGCIGRYNNTALFLNEPGKGESEIDVLKDYGIPAFVTAVEDQKVYGYKVRDVQYLVLAGMYKGHDLLIICRDGRVVETKRVIRPNTLSILHPPTWAVTD